MSKQVVKYTETYVYGDKHIPCTLWARLAPGEAPDTVLFLGAGQIHRVAQWVCEQAPAGTVVVEGLPHWYANPSGSDLTDFTTSYIRHAYDFARATFGQKSMHLMAESQAAPGVVQLANTQPQTIRNVLLLLPLGLNARSLGSTNSKRFAEFAKRIFRTLGQPSQSPLYDVRNLYIGCVFGKILFLHNRNQLVKNHYTIGVSYDSTKDLQQLHDIQHKKHCSLTLFLGGHDIIFPPAEIQTTLESLHISDLRVRVFQNVSHGSFAIRKRKDVLVAAVAAVRQA